MIFNSVWSLLVLAYVGIVPIYATRIFHKLASLALLAITTIFWFAGAIALAVFTGVPACGSNTYCSSLQAAVAFGFFLWAIFMFLCALDALEAMRSRGHAVDGHHHTKTVGGHTYPGV
jgi:Membrane-associating domain